MLEENESLLVTQARNGVPLLLPWGHQSLIPGTGFNSEKMMQNPWMGQSAFLPFDPHFPYVQYDARGGGCANYRSAESDSHGTSHTHYSGSLSATVDVKFASVSVTGSYDKDIRETTDSTKVSRNMLYKAGMVQLTQEPELNLVALGLLNQTNGEAAFRALYGDYFIAGFTLGGDSGAFLSVDETTKHTTDTVALKATVKVLFFKPKTVSASTTKIHDEHGIMVKILGYDTLNNYNMSNPRISLAEAQERISDMVEITDSMAERVTAKLKELNVEQERKLTLSECAHLCASGVVVQVLLLPFHTLRGYQQAMSAAAIKNKLRLQIGCEI